jgi:cysteine-rich repeat protein
MIMRVGDSLRVSYRWRDMNGNCFSPGFESVAEVSSDPSVQIAGTTDTLLDAEYCGFYVSTNPNRPWCTDQRALGAGLIPISVSTNCEGLEQTGLPILTDINFVLGDFRNIVSVRTQCPVCGDGLVEGAEQCDDGNLTTGDGCSEYCQRE